MPYLQSFNYSIPLLVETATTSLLENALSDDGLKQLMMIVNHNRYNSSTSITANKTTDTDSLKYLNYLL